MLIVEGPDGGGKTTFIRDLREYLMWPVAERVVAKDTTTDVSLKDWVERNVDQGWQRKIYDRHRLISEPIYGPLIRGDLTDGFNDPSWFSHMWHKLTDHVQPFVIWCMPPLPEVINNVTNDPDNSAVAGDITRIYWAYWTAMCTWPGYAMRWDYTVESNTEAELLQISRLLRVHSTAQLNRKDGFN